MTQPEPFNAFNLDVGDGHRVYVEEFGNPDGVPLINFHGGPGSYTKPKHRARYDVDKFRVILFDQRGAGQSTPLAVDDRASLASNSPASLIADAEKIREHLGIDRWHVTGVSWGSTLALLYAIAYPERTASLTLRALFLGQEADWAWMAQGAQLFNPAAYRVCAEMSGGAEGIDLIKRTAAAILNAPQAEALATVQAFLNMEYGLEILIAPPSEGAEPEPKSDAATLNAGLLYAHMVLNHILDAGWCVTGAAITALKDKSVSIVHGACDALCPVKSAHDLIIAHPHINLVVARNAGHGVDLDGEYERLYQAELARL